MVDGAFDPLHRGHIEYFRAAPTVSMCRFCATSHPTATSRPSMSRSFRRAAGGHRRCHQVHHVHARQQFDTETILRELQPEVLRQGKDWDGRLPPEQVPSAASTASASCISIPSSIRRPNLSTKSSEAQHSDEHYRVRAARPGSEAGRVRPLRLRVFTGDWRAEGNNYNLETRRQIEAKNPPSSRTSSSRRRCSTWDAGLAR
jgi:glycerol-3-phosphate cytidylyltransferase-like family protein